jgi:hypothetical protein
MRYGALALAMATAPACRCAPEDAAPAGSGGAREGGAPLAASAAPRPRSSPRLSDPRWRRAGGEDPLERARLAEEEGAAGLLEALDDGGEIAAIALRALPRAPDAEIALGPLAERARAAPPAEVEPVLRALLEIAGEPPAPREPLDPEGARAAGEAMLEVGRRGDLPPSARALAISSARALAARGYVDPAAIPADLDAPSGTLAP